MRNKTIHYCWFGHNKMPKLSDKCIKSWKKYLPDYDIKEWNEDNFDVNIIPYTTEAYNNHNYAFVSDYARFWILYHYGGFYFDIDVEVIKPLQDIIKEGEYLGRESINYLGINPGLGMYFEAGNMFLLEMLQYYSTLHYVNPDGTYNLHTVVEYTSEAMEKHGVKKVEEIQEYSGIKIYPKEFFSPFNYSEVTKNTYTIHHCASSWKSQGIQLKMRIARIMPKFVWNIYKYMFK